MTDSRIATAGALADPTIHEQWVSAYRTPEAQMFYELAFDTIGTRLRPRPGATVLDAGCGSCAKSVLLAERGFTVVGVDFSQDALAMAAETVRARGLDGRITLRQADLLALPFEDAAFEYVLCWGVLMHVPEVERALAELVRVLRPGGTLIISEGNVNAVQSVALRYLKRLLGRDCGSVVNTAAGLVSHEMTAHGALVTRQTDMRWLVAELDRLGTSLDARLAGQLTELYVLAPWRWLRRAIHAVNHFWFRYVGWPGPAFGNILIFRKRA